MPRMNEIGKLKRIKGNEVTFEIENRLDLEELSRFSDSKDIFAELRFDDNRVISAVQRRKIFALFKDIAKHTGFLPFEVEQYMKIDFMIEKNEEYFSLSNCSVTTARNFISFIIELCFKFDIPFKEKGLQLQDDINNYAYLCIMHRKCVVCGKKADLHHVDTVGMGRDRKKVDNSDNRLIAVCREHHQEIHQKGQETFDSKYKIQGIILNDADLRKMKV